MAGDPPKRPPGEPMSHMQGGTTLFRALNPELYMVRPVFMLSAACSVVCSYVLHALVSAES